ncbi:DUF5107 domain-containing protein [Rathayibacter sp. VKM Ac-2856]|uniref:DUF5107 domain-containing protein n=1 Tax=unclassified Rathayibacter TaxID=2609250 RepID=UPI00156425BE|nr:MULTISPECIES: DUF5107 domain-containing protein [unclassified Rathayibacter]NQX04273.1 DUF5107 domain-containing protein [Rathayibacter sp. VKM Ac-2858]NQX19442.1 DUF5107 domain-containing protein [Rathayibacter sp. VKM Ac-2856]
MPVTAEAPQLIAPPQAAADLLARGGAAAWETTLTLPTYTPEEPQRLPMFLDRRVYQGSSGRVYPLPFIDRIASDPIDHDWRVVVLENEFVQVVVLPELGGRIYSGYDKTTGYDFFYRNTVIKPALVGLAGPWISGGVEFNWPQHHRPGTYLPTTWSLEHSDDGSVVVRCSDHDPFSRMKGMHGVRLRPGSSLVELDVRLHNRTSERHTFLWWANVAARVHDDYQSFFPRDVRYVADHARRAITAFPAADRPYYGVDYPALAAARSDGPAADAPPADRLDWYRNIPVPTSYMVVRTDDSFFGGYDHRAGAGFVHWADRRFAPGKKQWTWGDAPFGHAWDGLLTDADGPYVELMAGVYTDNQPDFSWLMPGETKTFSQYWYPISGIGVAHQATRDAAVHLDVEAGSIRVGVATTRRFPGATVTLRAEGAVLHEWTLDLAPGEPLLADLPTTRTGPEGLVLTVVAQGSTVLAYEVPAQYDETEPEVATEPPSPAETASVDELYLVGVHLAQYRHPTRSPLPYWQEALRRDPGDARVLLALADHAYRRGEYAEALDRLDASIRRLTARNGNPADAEALHLRGLILRRLGRTREAAAAFGKAAWDGKWAHAALFESARLSAAAGDHAAALEDLATSLRLDTDDLRARALRVVCLRALGRTDEAEQVLRATLRLDPLDQLARTLTGTDPSDPHECIDVALDLASFGEEEEAARLLRAVVHGDGGAVGAGNAAPIAACLLARWGEPVDVRALDLTRAFPAGLDAHDALTAAVAADPADTTAHALLGMLLYGAGRRTEAAEHWRWAIDGGSTDAVTHRNAGLAAYNDEADDEAAWRHYLRARELAPRDARLLYELDQLAARLGHSAADRLERLDSERALLLSRDDLTAEYADLLLEAGRAQEALSLLESRRFQPWEGGEGRTLAAWDAARTALGLDTATPPASLGEARPLVQAPQATLDDGSTDYFVTSLPARLLFHRD